MMEHGGEAEFRNTFWLVSWIKKKYTSKVFIDIWSLIGYIIDTFGNTAQDFYRNVVQKSLNKTRTCHSVWYWKIYSLNHFFVDWPFCDQMFKALKH